MIKALSTLGEKIVGFLGERVNYGTATDAPSRKLSRIIHVQGRLQVGLSWGSPEEPQCRGFTTEELSRLHFDQFDLREVYTDVTARLSLKTSQVVHRNLSERVGQITHTFKPKSDGGGM